MSRLRPPRQTLCRVTPAVLLVSGIAGALALGLRNPNATPPRSYSVDVPSVIRSTGDYAGSQACQECHETEHQSWRESFHRNMTQQPTEENMLAPWVEQLLSWNQSEYRLFQKKDEYWVRLPDPDRLAALQVRLRSMTSVAQRQFVKARIDAIGSVDRQVVLLTGSHHYQAFWVRGARGNELWQVPFVYHLKSQRFLPRHSVFLQPPEDPEHTPRWNSNCIQCHAVAGQPRHDEESDLFATEVAELGIACEACHGPGRAHSQRRSSWLSRVNPLPDDTPDPTIVNPGRLPPAESSEICGQCHSYFLPTEPETWWQSGFVDQLPPVQSLESAREILHYDSLKRSKSSPLNTALDSIFYADGTVRVGGREYNGLVKSPCYERGINEKQLGCLSCHAMHGSTPPTQQSSEAATNQACVECHTEIAHDPTAHSHHPANSTGNQCVNCHMPFTSYALLRGVRSHRISSPNASSSYNQEIPNACNQCHVDRSLQWTASALSAWFGHRPLPSSLPDSAVSQTTKEALSGNAAIRALAVHSLTWPPARSATEDSFQPSVLAEALGEPYAAIRFMAAQGLREFSGFEDHAFDFVAPHGKRQAQRAAIQQVAQRVTAGVPRSRRLSNEELTQLSAAKDRQPIRISE